MAKTLVERIQRLPAPLMAKNASKGKAVKKGRRTKVAHSAETSDRLVSLTSSLNWH